MANPIPLLETATHAAISDVLQADPFPISSIKMGGAHVGGTKKAFPFPLDRTQAPFCFRSSLELIMATAKVKEEVSMIVGPRQ